MRTCAKTHARIHRCCIYGCMCLYCYISSTPRCTHIQVCAHIIPPRLRSFPLMHACPCCVQVRTLAYTRACMHARARARTHTHTHTHSLSHTHARTHARTNKQTNKHRREEISEIYHRPLVQLIYDAATGKNSEKVPFTVLPYGNALDPCLFKNKSCEGEILIF